MRSREVRTVRILCVCVLVLCLIGLGTVVFGKTETSGKEVEQPSSKEMVLNLENDTEGSRIPAGYRENMIRLAIIRDGQTVFAIEKGPSENQEDFMEWYLTEPYETRQLVNVSDLYDFWIITLPGPAWDRWKMWIFRNPDLLWRRPFQIQERSD